MAKYSIGVDFGTLSGRALLVDLSNGHETATSAFDYPHAVIDDILPLTGERLPPEFALQHPQDYLDVLSHTIPAILSQAGISPREVVGISVDFTSCTMLPIKKDGTPLCLLREFAGNKHSYVKLWKHHAAQDEADRINAVAARRGEGFLSRYGGRTSSEWMLAKVWETLNDAPEVYAAADLFIEAGDYITMILCGNMTRNACAAGYKSMWSKKDGYPSEDFLRDLDPRLEGLYEDKLAGPILPVGSLAGRIDARGAALTGLKEGTAVAVANVDAHVALPAVGITSPGKMLMIMGTSTCHMLPGEEEKLVPGMCGVVADGIIPGYFGYEGGQCCVGDHFDWFVKNLLPASYAEEASHRGISPHKLLREKAIGLRPGQSGLIALDWWNGNRSVLVDANLTGVIAGLTLRTRPEEIYRALIEATAYGTRVIIDTLEEYGVRVDELFAAGGIAEKDEMMMQIYSDVTGREIRISGSPQAPALGSAMFGALAAGSAEGGFDSIGDAAAHMSKLKDTVYRPIPENSSLYELLYRQYLRLHDELGRGENDLLKQLRAIRNTALEGVK